MDTQLIDTVIRDHTEKLAELKQIYLLEQKLIQELQQLKTQQSSNVPSDEESRCLHMDRCTQRDRAIARAERFGLPMYGVMSIEEHRRRFPEMYPEQDLGPEMCSIEAERLKELLDIELDHYMQNK
jgi:hypothetical protein